MRVLLSTVGTRGDVQPVIALAEAVRARGHVVRLCVPPNFTEWAAGHGFEAMSVGIEMRAPRAGVPAPAPSPALATDLIANQFDVLHEATRDCDVVVAVGAHQYAARSMAEVRGIRCVSAIFAPSSLPDDTNRQAWNARALGRVNANRARCGQAPVEDVLQHMLGSEVWLAADATLAPVEPRSDMHVRTSGAWILEDDMAHDAQLSRFLDAGEPPVYVGFGSMPVPDGTARIVIDAVRSARRRVIVSRGWGDLSLVDGAPDCLQVDEVNQQRLFTQVAAGLHEALAPGTRHRATELATRVTTDGASRAAQWLE